MVDDRYERAAFMQVMDQDDADEMSSVSTHSSMPSLTDDDDDDSHPRLHNSHPRGGAFTTAFLYAVLILYSFVVY